MARPTEAPRQRLIVVASPQKAASLPAQAGNPVVTRASAALLRLSHIDPPPHGLAVIIRLEPGRADAVGGELLVAVLGIAGDPDRADHLAVGIADQKPAAFGKDLVAARRDQVVHEDRLLLRTHAYELRGAPERQRRIGFAERHLEADHRGAVLLLERLRLAAGLDHDDGERTAAELGAAREDRRDDGVGLIERDDGHWGPLCTERSAGAVLRG